MSIDSLKKQIEDIETSISEDATTEELYNSLVKAYYHAKDIIELQDAEILDLTADNIGFKEQTKKSLDILNKIHSLSAV